MRLKVKAKSRLILAWLTLIVLFLIPASPPLRIVKTLRPDLNFAARADSGVEYVNGQVICKVQLGVDINRLAGILGLRVLEDLEGNLFLLGLPLLMTVQQAVTLLNVTLGVEFAEPNYLLRVAQVSQRSQGFVDQRSQGFVDGQSPSDYFGQYAMQLIRVQDAQTITRGAGVTVGVIDTGVDLSHPVFSYFAQGYDYVDNDPNPADEGSGPAYGHGTMVAGIIALVARQATIMPLRAFRSDGSGKASDVIKAIRRAAKTGADVINMSFRLATKSQSVLEAIREAHSRGVVLVASAGNDNRSPVNFPASKNAYVLAVAATDRNDRKADFSNYGSEVDVCAPGVSIYSAYPGNRYAWWDGTSFAAPFASGEAALVLSRRGGDVWSVICNTAVNIDRLNPGYGGQLGKGRIDLLAAVR